MTAHHNIVSEHQGESNSCLYCGNALKKENWKSDHCMERHYKVNKCESCGKIAKQDVEFDGDGHDSWSQPIEKHLQQSKRIKHMLEKGVIKRADPKKKQLTPTKLEAMLNK